MKPMSFKGISIFLAIPWFIFVVGFNHVHAVSWPPDPSYDPRPLMRTVQQNYAGGPFSFAVVGEFKDGGISGGGQVLSVIDQNYQTSFAVTLGDMVKYTTESDPGCSDRCFPTLEQRAGWFMRKYPAWPVVGDQEGRGNYGTFYGLPTPSYCFNLGPARFVVLSYYNAGGAEGGRYPLRSTLVTNYDDGSVRSLEQTLREAEATGMHVFVFHHTQYYSSGNGTKYYANDPPQDIVDLYRDNNVRIVFQSDNPGYSNIVYDGVFYIRASGAYYSPHFFVQVEVDGGQITSKSTFLNGDVFDLVSIVVGDGQPPEAPTGLTIVLN
jgi:hypothetical protein